MDIYKIFGEHLRVIRKARGFTQEFLADKCNLSYHYISELERGLKNPTLETMVKLTNGLNLSLSELLALPKLEKDQKGKIIALISEADPRKQSKILKAVKILAT